MKQERGEKTAQRKEQPETVLEGRPAVETESELADAIEELEKPGVRGTRLAGDPKVAARQAERDRSSE